MTYTVVLFREPDGRYSISVPALKGCHTWGDTVPDALENVREAIASYLEVLREDGEAIPADPTSVSVDMTETAEALIYKLTVKEAAVVA
jgi:predicted RNase H-like HicB family nuclease